MVLCTSVLVIVNEMMSKYGVDRITMATLRMVGTLCHGVSTTKDKSRYLRQGDTLLLLLGWGMFG